MTVEDKAKLLLRFAERIKVKTTDPTAMDSKEVASILLEIEDVGTRRLILAQFMVSACSKGDVNEVVAWAVVMSHMEGKRPAPDVQLEAMHLINVH
jgi:hypothetical protein